jgi:putative spermidine/putrescine transport system ATP-binding protein
MLQLLDVTKNYGPVAAVRRLSLSIAKGSFLTILGPSGSGKTTTLMMVAGFILPDEGAILVAGHDVTYLQPYRRNIGMVFQNYALFPHMTVSENIAFPLRMRHIDRRTRRELVSKMLTLVGLEQMGSRHPRQLSGGQQQRVALARALVFDPPVLLMDEPLGALDRQLRQRMQLEIKHLQQKLGITVIYVTHDQEEALTMSDQIAIMNKGNIEQIGTPLELYESPANRFVAEFMGESNLIPAEVTQQSADGYSAKLDNDTRILILGSQKLEAGHRVLVSLRPERLRIPIDSKCDNVLQGTVEESVYLGEASRIKLNGENSEVRVVAKVANTSSGLSAQGMKRGDRVQVGWETRDGVILVK